MVEKKPNFIIIGAMKSATTSLYTYIKQHPHIFMTKVKEPMFFNNFQQENNYNILGSKSKKSTTLEEYLAMFKDAKNEKAIGEASPAYIYNENAPYLIKEHLPDVKIIAILRQPTDRAYSNFLHTKRADRENVNSFEQAIKIEKERISDNWSPLYHYIQKGFYSVQLKRYYNLFPKENIKVYLFEDLVKNPKVTLKDIFKFLNVDENIEIDSSKKSNVSGTPNGILGFILKKMRYYNLMPKFVISDYLPTFIINLLFKSVYKDTEKLDSVLRKELTDKYYREEILKLEIIIYSD
ncbi:MAG: sulfotransferase [Flavobacteriales bacterium]